MVETENFSRFNLPYFTGRVIAVEEITVNPDSGAVFEQDIHFQFKNGMTLSIQDNDALGNQGDLGKEKQVQLMAAVYSPIEKCSDTNPELGFYYNPVNKWHEPTIRGIIKRIFIPSVQKMIPFRRYVTFDIGIGEILLVLDERHDFSILHEGDCLLVEGGLLALLDIK
jgi:hypothetical protein